MRCGGAGLEPDAIGAGVIAIPYGSLPTAIGALALRT